MLEFGVNVRDLVAFCHRSGDIDHRYTPSPSAEQGIEGHGRIYRRRPESYQREYPVNFIHCEQGINLHLRGRADGVDLARGLVEEIKTCRVDAASIPAAVKELHYSQARIYAALVAIQHDLDCLEVRLTWLNIDSDEEFNMSRNYDRAELHTYLLETLALFSDWLSLLASERDSRQRSLESLKFPHGQFRSGQRDIAELVYKCVDQGGELMVEAPTGIGKTAAVLYPALKAMASQKHEAIVFVTSRTVGRRTAEDCLSLMSERGLQLCSLSLTAKESICFSPGKACHGDDCPFAKGYYDRLPAAMTEAVQDGILRRQEIESIARRHEVCPYQLAIDLMPWVDVLIADAHYVFSFYAGVGRMMEQDQRRWTVLVDEAHNLPERARGMYSGQLGKAELMRVKKVSSPVVKRSLEKVNRAMLALQKQDWPEQDLRCSLPVTLINSLGDFVAAVGVAMADDVRFAPHNPQLMNFYFAVLQWLRIAEHWGDEYRLELLRGEGPQGLLLRLNCLDPSRLLSNSHKRSHALVVFSATLSPQSWMGQLLGLNETAVYRRMTSPFEPAQLDVVVETAIDTRYRQREASAPQLAERLSAFLAEAKGNSIIYFPSYRYLRTTLELMQGSGSALPDRLLWQQHPEQTEADRASLFTALERHRHVVAFCILGGVFSEGIDLPGALLTNVAIVGVGLPQVGAEREQLRQWYQEVYGQGFEYAYLYPAMQKVDQALGRVVRTDTDRGSALLIDNRYGWPAYRELLPPWWSYR
ncbi:MAG: ATP-dependent DNA helicase [Halieaceae bacterium]|jgi:DNA excision repair protein ERCC-2|nr:ATP-dependent DNA helicase [Halieaceae bacterium]